MKQLLLLFIVISNLTTKAQDCNSNLTIELLNIKGGVYAGQKVTLKSKSTSVIYNAVSNANGIAAFEVPCNTYFDVLIPNYSKKLEVLSVETAGGGMEQTLTYVADMIESSASMEMKAGEKYAVDKMSSSLPDTLNVKGSYMPVPVSAALFTKVSIEISDLDEKKLAGEVIYITGTKRKKTVSGITDHAGRVLLYLPKGDFYTVGFKRHSNYTSTEASYTRGTSTIDMTLSYIGTRELERREKAEKERLIAEAKRLAEEKKKFEDYCKKLRITAEEGYRRKAAEYVKGKSETKDTVISAVLNRNKWQDKLIVCDLSGSMQEYSFELTLWYQLNHKKEKDLQFVFFNDGDGKADSEKKIGETGGIYYSPSKGVDSLNNLAATVTANGSGGDVAENNMEALIKGIKLAAPFKELIMIVDNGSPVKDIELLKNFNVPVHIILCGVDKEIMTDYLLVAWKTRGTIHTIEEDITKLAELSEGQKITINKVTYQIMGGKFVRVSKLEI